MKVGIFEAILFEVVEEGGEERGEEIEAVMCQFEVNLKNSLKILV